MDRWKSKLLGVLVIAGGIGAAMPYRHSPTHTVDAQSDTGDLNWRHEIVPLQMQAADATPTDVIEPQPAPAAEPPRVTNYPTIAADAAPPQLANEFAFESVPQTPESYAPAAEQATDAEPQQLVEETPAEAPRPVKPARRPRLQLVPVR